MTLEIHSKMLEEINRLADQFSRLTLSDEIKNTSTVNVCNDAISEDKTFTKIEKSSSNILNRHEPTCDTEILPMNTDESKYASFTDDTRLYAEIASEDGTISSPNDCKDILPIKAFQSKHKSLSDGTTFTNILSNSESKGAATCDKEVLPIDVLKIEDTSSRDEVSYINHFSANLPEDETCTCYEATHDKTLLLAKTIENNHASSGDKTTGSNLHDNLLLSDENSHPVIQHKKILPLTDIVIEEDESSSDKTIPLKFYAVALPEGVEHPQDPNTLVYTEFKDVLSAVKSYKGSRFKPFSKKKDALHFASQSPEKVVAKVKIDEDVSPFRSATSQETCRLRKYIEKGDEHSFVEAIWSNPKTLVGSCDYPTIVQEGMRYNALHVAAKFNKPYLCQLILDTIENPKFLQLLYPSKTELEHEKIIYRLLDLYINTPDKKNGDTPLHYASKFGCIDCVKVLLSHPSCLPDCKNNDNFTPREIVCNRLQNKSISLIEGIEEAFKGLLYIPVLRSEENNVPPIVGKPGSCGKIIESTRGSERKDDGSILSLKAFVGPMSPEIAEQFYLVMKKPSSSQASFYNRKEINLILMVRCSDKEKGLERIGRRLAEDLNIQWQEYFPFLNMFTNLAMDEGLRMLETHLSQQDHHVPYALTEQSTFLVHQYPSHVNPLAHYVNVQLLRNKEKDEEDKYDEVFCTPPSSPENFQDRDCFVTPPMSPLSYTDSAVFLDGCGLSKLDVDVLLAIGDAIVEAREYPNVSKWKSLVERELKNKEESRSPVADSLSLLTSVILPRLNLSEKICTPKKTLLNNAFCLGSDC